MSSNTDQFETLKEYYAQARRRYWMMASHERMVVNALALVVVVLLVFLIVVNPALQKRAQAEVELNAKRSVLQWVKDNEHRALQASSLSTSGSAPKSGQALMALVTSSSSQMGVSLKRYEPEGDEKLRVWLEDQSFNKTMRWLDSLQKQHGMTIVNVAVDASKEPGIVTAKIVLRG